MRSSSAADEHPVALGAFPLHFLARAAGGICLGTKPPLAPTGTISVFLTFCAFIRPRISVRKSSRRSDQRSPPRATLPMRRCTPSTRGEYTQISNIGRGFGSSGSAFGSSLSDRYDFGRAVRAALVVVGAQRRARITRAERAQDAVVVRAGDLLERLVDVAREGARSCDARVAGFSVGVEARLRRSRRVAPRSSGCRASTDSM